MLTAMTLIIGRYDDSEKSALTYNGILAIVHELDLLAQFIGTSSNHWETTGMQKSVRFARREMEVELRSRLGDEVECECSNPYDPSCEMCRITTDASDEAERDARDYEATERSR